MSGNEWITIPQSLLSAAAQELNPRPSGGDWSKAEDWSTEVPRQLIEGLVKYWSEDLGCDHSANICMCSLVGLVTELKLVLEGQTTCRECGGDGIIWDSDVHQRECANLAKQEELPSWQHAADLYGDFPGNITCPACGGAGVVPLNVGAT